MRKKYKIRSVVVLSVHVSPDLHGVIQPTVRSCELKRNEVPQNSLNQLVLNIVDCPMTNVNPNLPNRLNLNSLTIVRAHQYLLQAMALFLVTLEVLELFVAIHDLSRARAFLSF